MSNVYHGQSDDRRYAGDDVDITYNVKRCIHAEICIHRLSSVFDAKRRPWIDATQAAAEDIADVVARCPSGALHAETKAGTPTETTRDENTLTLWKDGPIQIQGRMTIEGAEVDIAHETRATLCRCGASNFKPFCDNTHLQSGFMADHALPTLTVDTLTTSGESLRVKAHVDGPLEVSGPCTIRNEDGDTIFTGTSAWLCRCGGSQNKPFCDGTHRKIGFSAP